MPDHARETETKSVFPQERPIVDTRHVVFMDTSEGKSLPKSRSDFSATFTTVAFDNSSLPNSSTLEFCNYVRQYTKEAVDMFVAAMRDEKMDMRFRLEAANWLVERGYGKPAMQVAAQSENDGSEQKQFRTVEEVRLYLLERGIDAARVPPPFAVIEGKTC